MKRILNLSLFLSVIVLSQAYAQTSPLKIGVVDTETIVKQLPEAAEAESKLGDIMKKYRDTLDAIQTDFTAKFEQYKKQETMMTPDNKRKTEEDLKVLQQRYLQYQEEKFGQTGEIARAREGFLVPMRKKVQEAISSVAKEEKMNFVFDKASAALMYAEDKSDITFRVIDKIKRGGK